MSRSHTVDPELDATVLDLLLLLGCGWALCYGVPRLRRWLAATPHVPLEAAATSTFASLRPLGEWGFDFERDLLERRDLSPAQARLVASLLSQMVLPLIGHVPLRNVDAELEQAVATVLRAQVSWLRGEYVVEVWFSFLNWSRAQAGLPETAGPSNSLAARRPW